MNVHVTLYTEALSYLCFSFTCALTAGGMQSSSFMVCYDLLMHSLVSDIPLHGLSLSFPPPPSSLPLFTLSLSERVLGIKIRTFGFQGRFKKRCVIIMNHVSHFDWLFFWSVVDRHGDFTFWKVITKDMFRQVPIIGKCVEAAD